MLLRPTQSPPMLLGPSKAAPNKASWDTSRNQEEGGGRVEGMEVRMNDGEGKKRFGELIPKTRRRRKRFGEYVKVAKDAR